MAAGVLMFGALAVACVVGCARSSDGRASWALMAVYFFAWTVATALLMRARVDLFADRIELVRWFGFELKVIPLTEIADADVDRFGLRFRLHSDKLISGPANIGHKGLGLELLGYRNRGDKIAATIMTFVAQGAA